VLGVHHTASTDEVKQAYRRKARENHPDLHPTEREKYNLRMAEINEAFEAISRERREA
jgi:molecular chaperone DnaJ